VILDKDLCEKRWGSKAVWRWTDRR